jgi:outer membrane scaffolding protein for murein synthesis (MipA/OmpV family)
MPIEQRPDTFRPWLPAVLTLALNLPFAALAQEPEAPAPTPAVAAATSNWEGAFGLTASNRPEYSGSTKQIFKLTPALFIRYGRFTITNASGFVTRRADDVVRGLGIDMVRSDKVRVNVALRFDAGRSEGTSEALKGLGDVKPTVRVRASANWRLEGPWRLGASWSVDAFGRGGGNFGDISGGWEERIAPRTVLSMGATLSLAGDRYMQTYYGVNDRQASVTGYPEYTPSAGLRDASVYFNFRHDLSPEWATLGGASATRLLGPAAASPLTGRKGNWGINAGIARRF